MALGLGGTTNLGIGLSIYLRDNFTATANRISNRMNLFSNQTKAIMRSNLRVMRNMGIGMGIAFGAIIRPMKDAIESGMEFEHIMISVKAATGKTNELMEELEERAVQLGIATIYSTKEVAAAMRILGMAGYTRKQILETIDAVVYLGAATDKVIGGKGGIADQMAIMLTTFNLAAEESMKMADVLTTMAVRSNLEVSDLTETMIYAGDVVTRLGISFEEAAAMGSVMANIGIRGSMAGTAMSNAFRFLTRTLTEFSTGKGKVALDRLGLIPEDMMDIEGALIGPVELFDKIQERLAGMGDIEALGILKEIFQVRGMRLAVAALRDPKIGLNLKQLVETARFGSKAEAWRIATEKMKSFHSLVEIVQSAWSALETAFFKALKPVLAPLLKAFISLIDLFESFAKTLPGKIFLIMATGMIVLAFAAGSFLAVFSVIGLLITSSKVGYRAMRLAAIFAWDAMRMAALKYLMVAKVATVLPSGLLRFKKGVMMGGVNVGGRIATMGQAISASIPQLGKMILKFVKLGGVIGIALTILSSFSDHIKEFFKGFSEGFDKIWGDIGLMESFNGLLTNTANLIKLLAHLIFGVSLETQDWFKTGGVAGESFAATFQTIGYVIKQIVELIRLSLGDLFDMINLVVYNVEYLRALIPFTDITTEAAAAGYLKREEMFYGKKPITVPVTTGREDRMGPPSPSTIPSLYPKATEKTQVVVNFGNFEAFMLEIRNNGEKQEISTNQ